jgi:hypothetical protein
MGQLRLVVWQRLADAVHLEADPAQLRVVEQTAAVEDPCRLNHGLKDGLEVEGHGTHPTR